MMDVKTLNKLLSGSKKGLQQFAVTQPMDDEEDDKHTIFRAVDNTDATKNIIIKITNPMHASNLKEFESSMKTYENLSQHCNICKLLNYEVLNNRDVSRGIRGVIVMEHCGMDLFYFITRRHTQINLNLTLSISLDLLNQIICLQGQNAVHGDIKIENVGMDEKNDETGNKIIKAKLVDFDAMPSIVGNKLNDYNTATIYDPDDKRTLIYHYAQNYSKLEQPFIQVILSLPRPRMLTPRYNIPRGINDKRKKSFGVVTFSNPDYLNIIDLYSWCYVILILLGILKIGFGGTPAAPVENVFVYRALLAIVMSIIIPNDYPKDVPVDVFDSPINADYRHKLVEGITVLVSFLRDVTVANDACTNNKIRLFLKLIQNCTSADELSSRFKSIVDANSAFYNTNIGEADPTNQAAFVVIDEHVLAHVAAPSGGTRRRRTRAKTHRMHAHKKGKKASKFKRMKHTTTRRMRY